MQSDSKVDNILKAHTVRINILRVGSSTIEKLGFVSKESKEMRPLDDTNKSTDLSCDELHMQ